MVLAVQMVDRVFQDYLENEVCQEIEGKQATPCLESRVLMVEMEDQVLEGK